MGKKLPDLANANSLVLKAGFNLGDTLETAVTDIKFPKHLYNLVFTGKFPVMKLLFMVWLPHLNFVNESSFILDTR